MSFAWRSVKSWNFFWFSWDDKWFFIFCWFFTWFIKLKSCNCCWFLIIWIKYVKKISCCRILSANFWWIWIFSNYSPISFSIASCSSWSIFWSICTIANWNLTVNIFWSINTRAIRKIFMLCWNFNWSPLSKLIVMEFLSFHCNVFS